MTAPDEDLSHETAAGFNALIGFDLVEWRLGFARLDLLLGPRHLNRSGLLHGGVLTAMLDFTLAYAGTFNTDKTCIRRAVTLSVNTSFLAGARSGRISCTAQQRGGGKTIFISSGEITDEAGTLLALGEGTFRYIADLPRIAPPITRP